MIIAQGANIGGWSLYAKGGKLKYCYNWGGFKHFMIEATTPIPSGDHQVRMEFAYAGTGFGKGGKVTLYTDGKKVGEGNVDATLANVFSADDGCDVGETPALRSLPTTDRTATHSTAGSRAYSSRSPRPRTAPTTWLTLTLRFASRWRGSIHGAGSDGSGCRSSDPREAALDKFVISDSKRQRQAHFATILGALVTAGSMVFGVLTYQRSATENRQAASLSMLQEYLKLSVEHPDLASRAPDQPADAQIYLVRDARAVHCRNALESGRR